MVRTAPLIPLILAVAVAGTALLSQYWGGLRPCELCLYERWPYYAAIALTLLAVIAGRSCFSRAALLLTALIFVASAALAFYHVGVEQHWFAGPSACTGDVFKGGGSIEDLRKRLLATPPVRCDEIQWSVFGLDPLVDGNFVVSIVLAVLSFGLVARTRKA